MAEAHPSIKLGVGFGELIGITFKQTHVDPTLVRPRVEAAHELSIAKSSQATARRIDRDSEPSGELSHGDRGLDTGQKPVL